MIADHKANSNPERTLPEAFRDLADKRVWMCSDPKGKPISPITGNAINHTSPDTWGTLAEAQKYVERNPDHTLALVVAPDTGLVCIDLDAVIAKNGDIKPWAKALVEVLDSYTEVSSSGRGLHIIARGKRQLGTRKKITYDGSSVEFYCSLDTSPKPIKLTGDIFGKREEIRQAQEELDRFYRTYFPEERKEGSHKWNKSPVMTDAEVLERLRKAKNAERFSALFDKGDLKDHGGDASAADQALVNMIAFYTQDPEQVDRIFRQSKICREDKWIAREDYRNRTIKTALRGLGNTYQGREVFLTENIDHKEAEKEATRILESADPCQEFTLEHLPEKLREYIKVKSETTEALPLMLMQSVLSATSAFIKKQCYIPKGEYFQDLYPNVWVLNIHSSGAFKTTALKSGHAPCAIQEKELRDLYAELKILEAVKQGRNEARIQEIKEKLRERSVYLPNRVTAEAFIENLSEGQAGTIMSSEFGGWLSSLESKYNGDLKALFTDFYDVPDAYVYHSKTGGRQRVERPFISICGVAALPWITKNLTMDDVESGFFPRFLIYWPHEEKKTPKALPDSNINEKERQLDREIHERLSNLNFKHGGRLEFGEGAKEYFSRIHNSLYKLVEGLGDDLEAILNPFVKRWSPTILKLAMLIRVYDDDALKTNTIEMNHLLAAVSVIQPAINSTIKLISRELGETIQQKKMRKIREYIAKRGGRVRRDTLVKSNVLGGGAREYDAALESLEARGEIQVDRKGQLTKPAITWEYLLVGEST